MDFMSRFIKHSLQPSRRIATDYSLASQIDQKSAEFSSHEKFNRPVKNEMQTDLPVTTTPDLSVTQEATHNNDAVDALSQAAPLRADTSTAVKKSSSTQSLEAAVTGYKSPPASAGKMEQLRHSETHQVKSMSLQNDSQQSLSSADVKQKNTANIEKANTENANRENFSSKTSKVSESLTEEIEYVVPAIQTDPNSKRAEMQFPSEKSTISSNSELKQTDIDSREETAVAVQIKKQTTTLTSNNTSPVSAQSKISNTAKSPETPHVRIGNINILVDDQARARPAVKPVSNIASPSIPFGLRGL
jgi:hypothetical protein